MDNANDILERYWGYNSFRPLQREAIDSVLNRRDSLVVLPTGGGKSLCYQVPALLMDGMALVVSPLISLMKDQVDALRANGVAAAAIHSMLSPDERRDVADDIEAGNTKILYVSPERLAMPSFVDYLKRLAVSFIAIDEAHCISHWGHDFRPEYRELRLWRERFPGVSLHACTATATQQVRDDIVDQLGLDAPEIIVGSFDRPNLVFRTERRTDEFGQLRALLDRHRGESGIVYCISRKKVDLIAGLLQREGLKALPYHAGMDDRSRRENQEAFIREDADIIVATVAFGMGIDKSNVRYVAHLGMPKSLEHYQQECGRAGRDDLEAECCLFYSGADFMIWKRMLGKDDMEGSAIALKKLDEMYAFCSATACRRKSILEYFGECYEKSNCGACDMCLDEGELHSDALDIAQKILSCVVALGRVAGPSYTTLVLHGSREQRIVDRGHDQLGAWGALSDHDTRQIRDWIEQLVGQGLLEKTGEYNVLQLTPEGGEVLDGAGTARLRKPERTKRKSKVDTASWEGVDKDLFEELRALRKSIADERGVPAFVVFGDASLRDMARRRPTTLEQFLLVHGVGRKKCDDLGDVFVAAIRRHCDASNFSRDIAPTPASIEPVSESPPRRKRTSASVRAAFELFETGEGVDEVAEKLGRAESTVYGYLERYVRDRGLTDPNPWVDSELYARVREAVEAVGADRLRPIYLHLNEEVSYEDIRIAMACLRNEESQ